MSAITRAALGGVAAVWLGAWCLSTLAPVQAGGELQGRELTPARDLQTGLESGLETLLGKLLGGGSPPPSTGRIESVVVTEDGPARLTVSVICSPELEGRRVRGELIGRDRRGQRQFRTAPARFEAGSREAQISFEPRDGAGADGLAESAYLRISVDGAGPELRRVFELNKTWQGGDGPAYVSGGVVRIRPRPEPLAAKLPPTEPPAPSPAPHGLPVVGVFTPMGRDRPAVARDQPGVVRDHRGVVRDDRTEPMRAAAPPSTRQREAVLSAAAPVVKTLSPRSQIFTMGTFSTAADQNPGAKGPGPLPTDNLLPDIDADPIDLDASQVASVNLSLFRDQNTASPYFYFLPNTYHLGRRTDQRRYDMAMLYLAATAPGAAGEVSMAAGLTAGIDQQEINVVQQLLRAYCHLHQCPSGEPQLLPFPIDPSRVGVSLAGALRLFNIPAEKVAPVGLSTAVGDFQLAWVTDAVTKENVQLVMEQGGINGSVTFAPPGTEHSNQLVAVQIKLGDAGSFERSLWRRGEPWRNPAPYPLRLKYLHALLIGADGKPVIYSWNLDDALVPAGGRVEWNAAAIPRWIDDKALRMWVNYAVVEDCDACKQQVMKAITAGVTSVAASQLTFHTIDPLAAMGAYELTVRVRSRLFDPDGREAKEKSVVLKADNQDFTLGPIYVGEPAAGAPDALFEYFLTVAMADGTLHAAQRWIPSSDLRVLIGRSQIEKALGFLPGAPPPAAPTPAPSPEPRQ